MWPTLLRLGSFTLATAALFNVAAVFAAGFVFWRFLKEEHYNEDELMDVLLMAAVWGLIGSRIGFVLLHLQTIGWHVWQWFDIVNAPGWFAPTGFLLAGWVVARQATQRKWEVFSILDYTALALSVGFFIAIIGSFFDGSGGGAVTTLPWGLAYPGVFDRRHPVPLYSLLAYLPMILVLFWSESRYRTFNWYRDKKHSAQPGFIFCVFVLWYGLAELLLSFVRTPAISFFDISFDPIVYFAIFVYGSVTLYHRTGRTLLPHWRKRVQVVRDAPSLTGQILPELQTKAEKKADEQSAAS